MNERKKSQCLVSEKKVTVPEKTQAVEEPVPVSDVESAIGLSANISLKSYRYPSPPELPMIASCLSSEQYTPETTQTPEPTKIILAQSSKKATAKRFKKVTAKPLKVVVSEEQSPGFYYVQSGEVSYRFPPGYDTLLQALKDAKALKYIPKTRKRKAPSDTSESVAAPVNKLLKRVKAC